MTEWDSTVDFVIVGSGGGGMVAALTADAAGASALVLEKQELVGGSTAMSGGVVWVPDNPVMRADGVPDSYEDAMAHFDAVVGDVGPASSFERRHAFLTGGPRDGVVPPGPRCRLRPLPRLQRLLLQRQGRAATRDGRSSRCPSTAGCSGTGSAKLQPGLAQSLGLAVMTNEARSLSHYNRSIGAFTISARVAVRTYAARARGQALLTNGASLIGQMLAIAIARGIPVWTEAPLDELIVEDGRVVGVRTAREGAPVLVRARRGVLLAAGGFAHNPGDARGVRRRPAEPGQVVDRQPGRHRRSAPDRDAARRADRPDGRGLVAARHPARASSGSRPSTRPASGPAPSTSTPTGSAS